MDFQPEERNLHQDLAPQFQKTDREARKINENIEQDEGEGRNERARAPYEESRGPQRVFCEQRNGREGKREREKGKNLKFGFHDQISNFFLRRLERVCTAFQKKGKLQLVKAMSYISSKMTHHFINY